MFEILGLSFLMFAVIVIVVESYLARSDRGNF